MAETKTTKTIMGYAIKSRILLLTLIILWRSLPTPYDTSTSLNPTCLSHSSNPPILFPLIASAIERDLAQSRVQDLLQIIGNDQSSITDITSTYKFNTPELRRLTFLKDTFFDGSRSVDGQAQKLVSSDKVLQEEKEILSKLINKRFSSDERKRLYSKWGIQMDSKRRRLQLISQLWTDTEDMDHVEKSATIVAKLVKLTEQGRVLKGMFGLSFSPLSLSRRSYGLYDFRLRL